ncbi:MAG: ketopantoate reductase family protein [Chloroflexota bacterium]
MDAPTTGPLNILVFGAGAVGTYIGGSLALGGQRVVFVERPEVAEALRHSGLTLILDGQARRLEAPRIAGSLAEALAWQALEPRPFDAALFALKSYDTAAALDGMRPFSAQLPPLVCLQNGVDNETAIAGTLGSDKVIGATLTSAIGRPGPGQIALEKLRGAGVAGAPGSLAQRLQQAMDAAGLNCRLYPRAADMKWSKMLTNLLSNASSAILDLSPAQVFGHPGLYRLEIAQLREALAVMQAQGIEVVDLPGTPVRLLALGVRLPAALSRPLLARQVGGGRGAKMPSFHIDLHSGHGRSEVGWLNGAVARAGQQLGLPTPANRLLTETLQALTEGRLPLESYAGQPRKLLEAYSQQRSGPEKTTRRAG